MIGQNMPNFIKSEVKKGTIDIPRFTPNNLQGDYLISEPDGCASVNFSDLPHAQSVQYAKEMKVHSATSFAGRLQNAGYLEIPVTYTICKDDVSIPPALQRSVIEMISTQSGREVRTLVCNSGHFPNISAPAELASLI